MNCAFFILISLVVAVNSQSYPRFEFREDVLTNNSFIVRGAPLNIGEGQNDSLHCVTDNSDCCNATDSAQGNWYDPMEREVQQGQGGNHSLYVTRGDGVVYLNRKSKGGQSGMWRCDIPDSNGVQQSIYIYLGTSATGIWCNNIIDVYLLWFSSLTQFFCKQQVDCHQQSFTSLWTLRLMGILLSSLSHVRVEEDQSQRWSG